MLADLAAQLWPALPLMALAGLCFILAGALWLFVIRRHELMLGDADVPTYVEPATVPIVLPPTAHLAREDADTHVIVTPGAVALERWASNVEEFGVVLTEALEGLRVIPSSDPPPDDDDFVHDEIIIGPKLGPVCNVCGGPFGGCTCHIKSAPRNDCPLTTDEIRIPTSGETPAYTATVARAETQDLTVRLDQILERERVA